MLTPACRHSPSLCVASLLSVQALGLVRRILTQRRVCIDRKRASSSAVDAIGAMLERNPDSRARATARHGGGIPAAAPSSPPRSPLGGRSRAAPPPALRTLAFFQGVDWEAMENMRLPPPLRPDDRHPSYAARLTPPELLLRWRTRLLRHVWTRWRARIRHLKSTSGSGACGCGGRLPPPAAIKAAEQLLQTRYTVLAPPSRVESETALRRVIDTADDRRAMQCAAARAAAAASAAAESGGGAKSNKL